MIPAKALIKMFEIQAKLHWKAKLKPEIVHHKESGILKTLPAIQNYKSLFRLANHGKEWLFLYDRGNLLVWCRWWGAQTSDHAVKQAGVSRAGRFCISSPVLQTFIHVSCPMIPSVPLLINQKGTSDLTIEDLLDWSWLDYCIYLE